MTSSILLLALAYALVLFLLLLALLKSELRAPLKVAAVILVSGFYILHYQALQAYRGWPADQGLPQRFEMLSRVVVEPNQKLDEEGGIYLWVRDLDQARVVPRAFRLPYSREVHQQVDDTLRRQQQGQRFVGRPVPGAGSGSRQAIEFRTVERERQGLKPGSTE